jgi:hypothetical protein
MSEHKKINIEALRYLLRYGRKVSGPWDDVDMADDEWMADDDDADLLAAAPELLKACEAMLTMLTDMAIEEEADYGQSELTEQMMRLTEQASKSIQKARGG